MAVREVTALQCALKKIDVSADRILQTITLLTHPPIAFYISAFDHPETESAVRTVVKFDRDLAARMFRFNERRPDPEVTWKKLTRLERKRAERLWNWAIYERDRLSVSMQGRPPKIDSALVLYCVRVICEARGQSRFKFKRPEGGGPPSGPMWRVVFPEFKSDSIAEIVTTSRKPKFAKLCQSLGLGPAARDISLDPATFRVALALARRSRPRKRQ